MICEYGCGQEAKFIFKNGLHCCSKKWSSCPESRNKLREKMKINNPLNNPEFREKHKIAAGSEHAREGKREWSKNHNVMKISEVKEKHNLKMKELCGENNPLHTNKDALNNLRESAKTEESRKKKSDGTKKAFVEGRHPMCFEVNRLKMAESLTKPIEEMEKYRNYNEQVWKLTCKTLIKHKKKIENYHLRGRKHGYQLDHKYSIYQGFINNVDPKLLAHVKNLEIIQDSINCSKQDDCSISLEELIEFNKSE